MFWYVDVILNDTHPDVLPSQVVVQKDSPRGVHFRRAGPRQRVGCLGYMPIII